MYISAVVGGEDLRKQIFFIFSRSLLYSHCDLPFFFFPSRVNISLNIAFTILSGKLSDFLAPSPTP